VRRKPGIGANQPVDSLRRSEQEAVVESAITRTSRETPNWLDSLDPVAAQGIWAEDRTWDSLAALDSLVPRGFRPQGRGCRKESQESRSDPSPLGAKVPALEAGPKKHKNPAPVPAVVGQWPVSGGGQGVASKESKESRKRPLTRDRQMVCAGGGSKESQESTSTD